MACAAQSDSVHRMAAELRDMPQITNQHSAKGIEMTAYDEQRQFHAPIEDDTEVVAAPRALQSELCCPICLDLLTNTMTTKECLHRFCAECIQKSMMTGNRECPTCRKKLVSRRSLRPDPNFDSLIKKIYPSREAYDEAQARAIAYYTKQCNAGALQKSIQAGMEAQAKLRKQRVAGSYDYEKRVRRKRQPEGGNEESLSSAPAGDTVADTPARSQSPSVAAGASHAAADSDSCSSAPTGGTATTAPATGDATWMCNEVALRLEPSHSLKSDSSLPHAVMQTRYLKTTQAATVEHLCEYLRMRIQQDTVSASEQRQFLTGQQGDNVKAESDAAPPPNFKYRLYAAINNSTQQQAKNPLPLDCSLQQVVASNSKRLAPAEPLTLIFDRDK